MGESKKITIKVVDRSSQIGGPFLGQFNGKLPDKQTFIGEQIKDRKKHKASEIPSLVLRAETDSMKFQLTTPIQDSDNSISTQSSKFLVGRFNPETQQLVLMPATFMDTQLRPQNLVNTANEQHTLTGTYSEKSAAMTEAFGNRKAKQVIKQYELNAVNVNGIKGNTDSILDNLVAVDTVNLNQFDELAPPHNLQATDIQESYPLDKLIPKQVMEAIPYEKVVKIKGDINIIRQVLSNKVSKIEYMCDKLAKASLTKEKVHIRILAFMSYLLEIVLNRKNVQFKDETDLATQFKMSSIVANHICQNYLTKSQTSNFDGYNLTGRNRVKIQLMCIVLLLHLENFSLNLALPIKALKLNINDAKKYCIGLGCRITKKNTDETYATLTAPLQFPNLNRKAKAKRGF